MRVGVFVVEVVRVGVFVVASVGEEVEGGVEKEWRKVSVGDAVERRESTEYHCHGSIST